MCGLSLKNVLIITFLLTLLLSCSSNKKISPYKEYFDQAIEAYDNQAYEKAFTLFENIAKTGHIHSQHYLWVMYSNGQGVKKDFFQGFAWLAVAADSGDKEFIKEREDVLAQLTDKQAEKAKKEAQAQVALYGVQAQKDALSELLVTEPVFLEGPTPIYPADALEKEIKGYVILELTVTPEGKTRDVRVIESSDKVFEAESIKAAEHYTYQPVKKKGQSIETAHFKTVTTFRLMKLSETKNLLPSVTINALHGQQDITDINFDYLLKPEFDIIAIQVVQPDYPKYASSRGIEGYVRLEFTLTKDGIAKDIIVIESAPKKVFDKASIEAMAKMQFKPLIVNGKPANVPNQTYQIIFKMAEGSYINGFNDFDFKR